MSSRLFSYASPRGVRGISVLPWGLPALLMVLFACEDVVEIERPFFQDPPALAAGFLGYDEEAVTLTVCGNCHIGQQSEWEETAHAGAWETLEASGSSQEFCEACHTVNGNGNPAEGGGWLATGDTRYHDVQCESCHGPGETHVTNPDATQPLAFVSVGLELDRGCGECHSGIHHPFVDEWAQSRHAEVVTSAASRAECQSCHRGQAILAAWGVKADYVEKESADHLPITCAICHDPHDAVNAGQTRFPVETTDVGEHLCARCHDRRGSPDPTSTRIEPHAPETDLLQGLAGWFPPGADIDPGEILGTHGSERNARLCATCHVNSFTVTDEETGDFVFQATGHLFTAIPCVNEEGIPVPGDCPVTIEDRSFQGCTEAACHGNESAAFSALERATERIEGLAENLLGQLEAVDPGLTDAGGEIDGADPTFTTAEGALFNYELAVFGGDTRGSAVHNPFHIEALLVASIDAVQEEYGVAPALSRDWKAELRSVLTKAGR